MNWINLYTITKCQSPEELNKLLPKLVGFTYLITNLKTGMKYIGRKCFWTYQKKNKTGSNKRGKTESNWRTYTSSSNYVKADIENHGINSFRFEVIEVFTNKKSLSKAEDRLILETEAVLSPAYYNRNWKGLKANVLRELKDFYSN